jgi:hypothetical protein
MKKIINSSQNQKSDDKNNTEIKKTSLQDQKTNKDDIENLDYINNRIDNEYCNNTIDKLKDIYLINEYKGCKSVQNEIKKLELILTKHNLGTQMKESILNDYLMDLIPAGTKGVIRGNKFNSIVKNTINSFKLNDERFETCFEKQCDICITSEIPDWYILDKLTGKVIIGMNQLDLVGGGQQMNRGYKYLIDNKHNTTKSKLLCVICNYIQFKTHNKKTKLFEVGFANNTLCYIKNLKTIIDNYFN